MKECDICYDDKVNTDFCRKSCCNYEICKMCSDRLMEDKCPFCRKDMMIHRRRNSISNSYTLPSLSWEESMDDMFLNSRWYRRRLRRQERNRQLQVNAEMNRNTSRCLFQRKSKSNLHRRIRQELQDYYESL
jgi:hypothetical protein